MLGFGVIGLGRGYGLGLRVFKGVRVKGFRVWGVRDFTILGLGFEWP